MRNRRNSGRISQAQLELGLLQTAILINLHNKKDMPESFELLIDAIDRIEEIEMQMDLIIESFLKIANGKKLLSCGLEAIILDGLYKNFKSLVIVPNSDIVDFERIANNYSEVSTQVLDPVIASNSVNPDTTVIVPVFPLSDGTYMTYRYSSKLLTIDAHRNAYQIIALEICNPLPIQKGYDPSGLTDVMVSVDTNYFTNFIKLNELWNF